MKRRRFLTSLSALSLGSALALQVDLANADERAGGKF